MVLSGTNEWRNIYKSIKIAIKMRVYGIWNNNYPPSPPWLAWQRPNSKLTNSRRLGSLSPNPEGGLSSWEEPHVHICHHVPSSLLLKQSFRKCGREVQNSFLSLTPTLQKWKVYFGYGMLRILIAWSLLS